MEATSENNGNDSWKMWGGPRKTYAYVACDISEDW